MLSMGVFALKINERQDGNAANDNNNMEKEGEKTKNQLANYTDWCYLILSQSQSDTDLYMKVKLRRLPLFLTHFHKYLNFYFCSDR